MAKPGKICVVCVIKRPLSAYLTNCKNKHYFKRGRKLCARCCACLVCKKGTQNQNLVQNTQGNIYQPFKCKKCEKVGWIKKGKRYCDCCPNCKEHFRLCICNKME